MNARRAMQNEENVYILNFYKLFQGLAINYQNIPNEIAEEFLYNNQYENIRKHHFADILRNGNLLYEDEKSQKEKTQKYVADFVSQCTQKDKDAKIVIITDPTTQHLIPDIIEGTKQYPNLRFEIQHKQQTQDPSLLYYGAGNVIKKGLSILTYPLEIINDNLLYNTKYYTPISNAIHNTNTLCGLVPKYYLKKGLNSLKDKLGEYLPSLYQQMKNFLKF